MAFVRKYPDYTVQKYPQDREIPDTELAVVFGTNGGVAKPIEDCGFTLVQSAPDKTIISYDEISIIYEIDNTAGTSDAIWEWTYDHAIPPYTGSEYGWWWAIPFQINYVDSNAEASYLEVIHDPQDGVDTCDYRLDIYYDAGTAAYKRRIQLDNYGTTYSGYAVFSTANAVYNGYRRSGGTWYHRILHGYWGISESDHFLVPAHSYGSVHALTVSTPIISTTWRTTLRLVVPAGRRQTFNIAGIFFRHWREEAKDWTRISGYTNFWSPGR